MEIIKSKKRNLIREERENRWKEDEQKEEIKSYTSHFLKGNMLRRGSRRKQPKNDTKNR